MATTTVSKSRGAMVGYGRVIIPLGLSVVGVGLALFMLSGAQPGTAAKIDLAQALAPLVALSVAVERFWEMIFGWYESVALATANLVGISTNTSTWMRQEVTNAEAAMTTTETALGAADPSNANYATLIDNLSKAETRLKEAKQRIAEALKAPEYVAFKTAVTTLGSLVLGLTISITTHLTVLNGIGFSIPDGVDVILTGLLIGIGPGPLHTLIETFQELRNALAGVADLAKGTGIQRAESASTQALTAFAPGNAPDLGTDLRVQRAGIRRLRLG